MKKEYIRRLLIRFIISCILFLVLFCLDFMKITFFHTTVQEVMNYLSTNSAVAQVEAFVLSVIE